MTGPSPRPVPRCKRATATDRRRSSSTGAFGRRVIEPTCGTQVPCRTCLWAPQRQRAARCSQRACDLLRSPGDEGDDGGPHAACIEHAFQDAIGFSGAITIPTCFAPPGTPPATGGIDRDQQMRRRPSPVQPASTDPGLGSSKWASRGLLHTWAQGRRSCARTVSRFVVSWFVVAPPLGRCADAKCSPGLAALCLCHVGHAGSALLRSADKTRDEQEMLLQCSGSDGAS